MKTFLFAACFCAAMCFFASANACTKLTLATQESFDYGEAICVSEGFSKVFVTSDQLLVLPNGIYFFTLKKDKLIQGEFVAQENGKVYVAVSNNARNSQCVPRRGPCGLHPVWHPPCGGCSILWCPMVCSCFGN